MIAIYLIIIRTKIHDYAKLSIHELICHVWLSIRLNNLIGNIKLIAQKMMYLNWKPPLYHRAICSELMYSVIYANLVILATL